MPILKQSPVTQSKKRPRIDRDMISAPLGDFRHTMHVGRGGDAFGDTSFLSNHGGPKPNGLPTATDGLAQAELPQLPAGVPGSPTSSGGSCLDGGGIALPSPPGSLDGELCYGESLFSFELDLGPSILEEVLGVMDKGGRPHEDSQGVRSVGGEGLSRSSPNPRQGEEELEEEEEEAGSGHGYSFDDELDDEIGL